MTSKKDTQTVINPPDVHDPNYERGTLAMGEKISIGEIPSNQQLNEAIEKTKKGNMGQETEVRKDPKMTSEAKRVVDTTYVLLDTAQQFLHEKNSDELLQRTWNDYSKAREELLQQSREFKDFGQKQITSEDKERWRSQATDIAISLRGLTMQLLRSSELRDLFNDLINLSQRIFLRSAGAATTTAPKQTSKPVGNVKTGEVPPPPPLPSWGGGGSTSTSSTTTKPTTKKMVLSPEEKESAKQFTQPFKEFAEGTKDFTNMSKETYGKTKQTLQAVGTGISEGNLPLTEEEKEMVKVKLQQFLIRIGRNENFQRSFRNFMDICENLYYRAESVRRRVNIYGEGKNSALDQALLDTQTLIERFTQGKSLDPLIQHWNSFVEFISNHPEIKTYGEDLKEYFEWMLDQPEDIEKEEFQQTTRDFVNRSFGIRDIIFNNEHIKGLIFEANSILSAIRRDRLVRRLSETTNLWLDNFVVVDQKTGATSLNTEMIKHLQGVITSVLFEHLRGIALPAIRITDKNQVTTVYGTELTMFEVPPDGIVIRQSNEMKVGFEGQTRISAEQSSGYIIIDLYKVKTALKNINYDFHRHSFPSITDHGIIHLNFGGDGLNLRIILDTKNPTERPYFEVQQVRCIIDKLNLKVEESKHEILLKMMTTLFKGRIKRTIEKRIEMQVANIFERFELLLRQAVDKVPELTKKETWSKLEPGKQQQPSVPTESAVRSPQRAKT